MKHAQKKQSRSLKTLIRDSIMEERGSAVLEVVIVIAVIMAVALLFNSELRSFAGSLFTSVFNDSSVLDVIG